jgi:hypothetical protein
MCGIKYFFQKTAPISQLFGKKMQKNVLFWLRVKNVLAKSEILRNIIRRPSCVVHSCCWSGSGSVLIQYMIKLLTNYASKKEKFAKLTVEVSEMGINIVFLLLLKNVLTFIPSCSESFATYNYRVYCIRHEYYWELFAKVNVYVKVNVLKTKYCINSVPHFIL